MIALFAAAYAFNHIDECNGTPTHWETQPSVWRLTKVGGNPMYSGLTDAEVTNAFTQGFAVWTNTSTCCSGWLSSNGGPTGTGFNANDGTNAIEFEENNWDPQFGAVNSVIAITLPVYFLNDCEIQNADELYNAVGFDFTVNNNPNFNQTDLQSIAAHENGHWLGLDHSGTGQATMFASYSGGTGPRTLHQDDEAGVCDSHPGGANCGGGGGQEANCTNGTDDDADGLIDCADSDCLNSGGCSCNTDAVIGCDNSLNGSTVGQANGVQSWGCANWTTTGPERVYSFVPSEDGPVTVTLTGLSADLDLFVTTEANGGCEPANCASSGTEGTADESVTFNGFGGVPYTVVVDGYDGASSSFVVSTDCPDPVGGGDCVPAPGPEYVLSCGETVQGSNLGFVNDVQDWSCAGWQTTGAEVVYTLTPGADGPVTLDLFGLSADIDLFVTTGSGGACNPNACLGVSGNGNAQSEQLVFDGQGGTTYFVIADGWDGASSDFSLRASCQGGGEGDADADADADSDVDVDADSDADTADPVFRGELSPCGCRTASPWGGLLALPLVAAAIRRRRA